MKKKLKAAAVIVVCMILWGSFRNPWCRLVVLGANSWETCTFQRYSGGRCISIAQANGDARLLYELNWKKQQQDVYRIEIYTLDNLNEDENTHFFTAEGKWLGSIATERRLQSDVYLFYRFTTQGQIIRTSSFDKKENVEVIPELYATYEGIIKKALRDNGWWLFF